MTGKITVGTIQDTNGNTVASTYVTNGVAKAWSNFDGTGTISIRDSLNISTLTDNGTGWYETNFGSNFSNTNYNIVGFGRDADASYATLSRLGISGASSGRGEKTTSLVEYVNPYTGDGNLYDTPEAGTTHHGDLA